MDRKKSVGRRIWRMTRDAPLGQVVDLDLSSPHRAGNPEVPTRVLDPAPVVDWRSSSFDLLNGLEVFDHTDSIPAELFTRLFKR